MQMDSWQELANPRDLTKIFTTPEYAQYPALGTYYYGVNMKNIPNLDQRRAMALAIDRRALIDNITQADQVPARGYTPEGMPGFDTINPDSPWLPENGDLEQYGQKIKGFEIIGHEHPFGAEPSEEIKSRFYDNMGNTLDYIYELEGDTLTIWGGEKGSPAYSKGTFSDDGHTLSSEWVYPGGGGYQSTMTRSK
jgi:hypothetical protein